MDLLFQLIKSGLVLGLLYGLLAYGLNLIVAVTGVLHFAYVFSATAAAYTFWWTVAVFALPMWLAVIISIVVGGVVGLLMYWLIYQPLIRVGATENVLLVASLSLLTLTQSLLAMLVGSNPRGLPATPFMEFRFSLGPVTIHTWDILALVASVALLISLWFFQNKTAVGLSFRAVGDNVDRAVTLGIRTRSVFAWAFFVGSIVAGVGGVLLALRTPIAPTMGFHLLVFAVIALIMGGIGSMPGAFVAGVFLGLVENVSYFFLPSEWAHFALYVVLFLFILLRPQGFSLAKGARVA